MKIALWTPIVVVAAAAVDNVVVVVFDTEAVVDRVIHQKLHISEKAGYKFAYNEFWYSYLDREFADKKSANYEGHLYC